MILYWTKLSSYSAKLRIACALKSISPELRFPPDGGYRSEAYRRIFPLATVPVLVDGDMTLGESDAIIEYLDEIHPSTSLLPGPARRRARIRFLSRFHDLHLEPHLRALFGQAAASARDPAVIAARSAAFARNLELLEGFLDPQGPFACGPEPTMADCGFPPTLAIADHLLAMLGQPPNYGPHTRRWRAALAADQRIESVMVPYRAEVDAWLAAKATA